MCLSCESFDSIGVSDNSPRTARSDGTPAAAQEKPPPSPSSQAFLTATTLRATSTDRQVPWEDDEALALCTFPIFRLEVVASNSLLRLSLLFMAATLWHSRLL